MKLKQLYIPAAVLIALFLCAVCYFLGMQHTEENLTFKNITANQAARAMQEDHFYADYKENTLFITGTVASVDGADVTFDTGASFGAVCRLNSPNSNIEANQTVRLITEGGTAERQPHGVLLKNCQLP